MDNNFWENQYVQSLDHHINQNRTISNDFLNCINSDFVDVLNSSKSLFEFGCGSGEMCQIIKDKFNFERIVGVDISKKSIEFASRNYTSEYYVLDLMTDNHEFKNFDIVLSSNVLEHFKNPHQVVERLFEIGNKIIIIVPYNQIILDDNAFYAEKDVGGGEGGGGHFYRFTEETFNDYSVKSTIKFKTSGWTTSTNGEPPLQIAYLLEK